MKILGTGSMIPDCVVTNQDLEKIVDTSNEWIVERTGIESRHIATTETTTYLAAKACERALADAGKKAEDVDLILVATVSDDQKLPCTACEVQSILGATNATAYNINAACAGFLFALNMAEAYFLAGVYKSALIVGAEVLSKIMDWKDRGTCVLFGDGAGAAYVEAGGDKSVFMQGSDGFKGQALSCGLPQNHSPFFKEEGEEHPFIAMDGKAVYQFAVSTVPKCVEKVLEMSHTPIEEIDYFILHQANERIIRSVAKKLHQDIEKFPMNIQKNGNISAASIPVLLDELNKMGKINRGQKLVLSGFGAGLTFGATVLTW